MTHDLPLICTPYADNEVDIARACEEIAPTRAGVVSRVRIG